jgi:hypothetical protein
MVWVACFAAIVAMVLATAITPTRRWVVLCAKIQIHPEPFAEIK